MNKNIKDDTTKTVVDQNSTVSLITSTGGVSYNAGQSSK